MNYELQLYIRFNRILQLANMTPVRWTIISHFVLDNTPVSENALAEISGISRTTIRPHIRDWDQMGVLGRTPDGRLFLEDSYLQCANEFGNAALEIARGDRVGLPEHLIQNARESYRRSQRRSKTPIQVQELKDLQFHPRLRRPDEIGHLHS